MLTCECIAEELVTLLRRKFFVLACIVAFVCSASLFMVPVCKLEIFHCLVRVCVCASRVCMYVSFIGSVSACVRLLLF